MSIFNNFSANHLPQRGLARVTLPAARTYCVTLAEAKQHLRIAHNDDDLYIESIIQAAQITAEYQCNLDFTACEWSFVCDIWEQTISIPYSNIRTIDSIKYYNDASVPVLTTLSSSDYYLSSGSIPQRITMVDPISYPSLRNGTENIAIRFTTEMKQESPIMKQAVLILLTDMYENRQSVIVGRIASVIPKTAQFLLDTLKIQTL